MAKCDACNTPYSPDETECLINQVNELRQMLGLCWSIIPDGTEHANCVEVKKAMTKYDCWPVTRRAEG